MKVPTLLKYGSVMGVLMMSAIYRSGATREPMKMAAMPDGVKLRLRTVY